MVYIIIKYLYFVNIFLINITIFYHFTFSKYPSNIDLNFSKLMFSKAILSFSSLSSSLNSYCLYSLGKYQYTDSINSSINLQGYSSGTRRIAFFVKSVVCNRKTFLRASYYTTTASLTIFFIYDYHIKNLYNKFYSLISKTNSPTIGYAIRL